MLGAGQGLLGHGRAPPNHTAHRPATLLPSPANWPWGHLVDPFTRSSGSGTHLGGYLSWTSTSSKPPLAKRGIRSCSLGRRRERPSHLPEAHPWRPCSRPVQQLRRPGPRWLQSGTPALKRASSLSAARATGTPSQSDGGKLAAKGPRGAHVAPAACCRRRAAAWHCGLHAS